MNLALFVFLTTCLGMPDLARSNPHEPHGYEARHGGAPVVLRNEWARVGFVSDPSTACQEAHVLDVAGALPTRRAYRMGVVASHLPGHG